MFKFYTIHISQQYKTVLMITFLAIQETHLSLNHLTLIKLIIYTMQQII